MPSLERGSKIVAEYFQVVIGRHVVAGSTKVNQILTIIKQ